MADGSQIIEVNQAEENTQALEDRVSELVNRPESDYPR